MDSTVLTKHANAKAKKVVQLDNPKQVSKTKVAEPDMKELLAMKLQQLETEPQTVAVEPTEQGKGYQTKVE